MPDTGPADLVQIEWSCGCITTAYPNTWKIGYWGRCSKHSAVTGYDPRTGDPEFDRDVQVVDIQPQD